jgi:hypothetical protein
MTLVITKVQEWYKGREYISQDKLFDAIKSVHKTVPVTNW